jgi:hypothetical protein
MSLVSLSTSIQYGESSIITVYDLSNVTIKPSDSVLNIDVTLNSVIITVQPQLSTIYYISGYNALQQIINLNETIYVNVTVKNNTDNEIKTIFNKPVQLNAFGSISYIWYPSTYLNQTTGNSVICTPYKNITYTITGTDSFNTISRTYIKVFVNSNIIFTPSNNIQIYEGNLLNLSAFYNSISENTIFENTIFENTISENTISENTIFENTISENTISENTISENSFSNDNLTYKWLSNFYNGLPLNCCTFLYGETIKLNPYKNIEYTLTIFNKKNNQIISSDIVKINVISKPSNIIDIDILPYSIYQFVLDRNKLELRKALIMNKSLSKKISFFYYTILQTSYKMEWTNKDGIPYVIPWTTLYQIKNETNEMILSFEQQWKFFQYINQTTSNFAYLLSILNS